MREILINKKINPSTNEFINQITNIKNNSELKKPLIFSFFSGAGFLDLGFEEAGFQIGYVNEIHKPFLDAYKFSRENINLPQPQYGYFGNSIEHCLSGRESRRLSEIIKKEKKERIVGFVGGPPCPDFSIGGKNRGKDGENGKLSKIYINLICKHKPDFFIFENVKGLYRTIRHRQFFDELKNSLKKSGYDCVEKLINAIDYGVPQHRERIILFGTLKSRIKSDIKKFDWSSNMEYLDGQALRYPWPQAEPLTTKYRPKPKGIPTELTIQYWFEKNNVELHPNAQHHFKPRSGLSKFKTIQEGDDSKKSYKRLHRWRYSPTAAYGNNEVHIHPYLPRRISVAEALAIQSLPKKFILPDDMTLTNMFKTIGNGVPFLAAKGIALTISDFLKESEQ